MSLEAKALATTSNKLYATCTNAVLYWNGSAWSLIGISGNSLYAGGSFTTAGGKSSAYLAKAIVRPAEGRFQNCNFSPVTGFNCTFTDASVGLPYRIQASPSLAPASWVAVSNFTYTAPIVIRDASAASGTQQFFRAVAQ